ncbi:MULTISPECIES: hypothetical protein [unclassified Gilliamella]|uniref:hypothetical protein n=1 Tax=unclassified Gilliamella TaxID=2685620 RepID=UPI001327179E|nr:MULTISPECIES: hypothetical protein [unclassified Gilliamella]MWN31534.1 hypothetical protein [Gilliamella sp. Pra-s60]MWP28641.1 hypothetical protein [Gilliamella sp. Pra-s54]
MDVKIEIKQKITLQENKNALPWLASGIWHLACQTYALNLIDSHSGQNRAPQLFLSPKSFRVAKSTPFSTKLSSISKLLSKSSLFFVPLVLLSYTQGTQALMASTANTIEGSAPYLSFDGGITKIEKSRDALWVSYEDNGKKVLYTPDNNPSSEDNPILLPETVKTFTDINMVIPKDIPILDDYNNQVNFSFSHDKGYFFDDDGDNIAWGQGVMRLAFLIGEQTFRRSDFIDPCWDTYQVNISFDYAVVYSDYGIPNQNMYDNDRVSYYVKPTVSHPYSCWLFPSGHYGILVEDNVTGHWAGNYMQPKGYLVQDINQPSTNFPTGGSNAFDFVLTFTGANFDDLSFSKQPADSKVNLSFEQVSNSMTGQYIKNKVKVNLLGPVIGQADISFTPTTFTIFADKAQTIPIYRFRLNHWFVVTNDQVARNFTKTKEYCESLGYRLPTVSELTNYKAPDIGWDHGYPPNMNMYPVKQIGGGLISEWGTLGFYTTGFYSASYWTSNHHKDNNYYSVYMHGAVISNPITDEFDQALCVSP